MRSRIPEAVVVEAPPLRAETWRTTERIAWAAIIAFAAVHLWLYRFEMTNLDGISYLELGEAWRDGRWSAAINTYWSPLYAWVLGAALAIVRPTPEGEYPLVHAANGVIVIGALGGLAYLLRAFMSTTEDDRGERMPAAVFVAVAYALFAWAAIELLVVWMESPDLLGAIFVFTASGALVRIVRGDKRMRTAVLLGASVGLGYLARAAMLPIGVAFVAAPLVAPGRRTTRAVLVAAVAAAVFVVPWVAAMSMTHHRLTTGDAGRLNYVWFVNDSEDWPNRWPPHWPHFSGEPQNGVPVHPARRLSADPVVYEFARPIAGTYPMWYDPSWWYDGVHAHADVKDQLRRLWISAGDLYHLATVNPYNPNFFNPQPALAALVVMLLVAFSPVSRHRVSLGSVAPWVPPLVAVALYAAVYVEPRYLGAYIVVLWLLAIEALRARRGTGEPRLLRAAGIAMTVVLAATVTSATWIEGWPALQPVRWGEPARVNAAWLETQRMFALGLRPGDPIGVAGSAQVATRWAHLARVRIIAEVPQVETPKVLTSDGAARTRMLDAFARAGARWAVIEDHGSAALPGWQRVEGFPYLVKAVR